MGAALNATRRPILYSCEWPLYLARETGDAVPYAQISETCNLWRNTEDVQDSWDDVRRIIQW